MPDILDLRALRDIGLTHHTCQALLAHGRPDGARLARIVEIQRDHVVLHDGVRAHDAVAWPTLRLALEMARDALVVGDWVWWRPADDDGDARGWVLARLPARNRLTRRDAAGARQGLVANIDTAWLVMGPDHDFNLRRLDRFLVLARTAQARPVVVLTKADRCAGTASAIARVRAHLSADGARELPVVALDGRLPGAREALAPWLVRGATLVMLGSSGAGKTTLANTLAAAAAGDATQAVREADHRGRHTTSVRTLHRTPGGACLIDTPGLRQLWLDADAEALRDAFPEIGRLAAQCRYRDCGHAHEPGCAVRESVAPERLKSFGRLLRETTRDGHDLLDRKRQLAVMKRRARDNRERIALRQSSW